MWVVGGVEAEGGYAYADEGGYGVADRRYGP